MGNLLGILFWLWALAGWGTHIVTCFADGSWGFLIAGALMFPVAVFYGTQVWFN
jgi:hypothetical protein